MFKGLVSIDCCFQACFKVRDASSAVIDEEPLVARENITEDAKFLPMLESQLKKNTKLVSDTIMGHLSTAGQLGGEADQEPRYWRAPWPLPFFESMVRTGHILHANLKMVEQVLEGAQQDALYDDIFKAIRQLPAWKSMGNLAIQQLWESIIMAKDVLDNVRGVPAPDIAANAIARETEDSRADSFKALFKSINTKSGLKFPPKGSRLKSLEYDQICRVNVVLMLMDASLDESNNITKECLKMIG
jgi:hypothetical protein